MKECPKCNVFYEDKFSFCQQCGSPLTLCQGSQPGEAANPVPVAPMATNDPVGVEQGVSASSEEDASKQKQKLLIGGLCVVVALLGYMAFGRGDQKVMPSTASRPQTHSSAPAQPAQSREMRGSVTGDEVFMRELPTTESGKMAELDKGHPLTVLGQTQCNDPNAAIVVAPRVNVNFLGHNLRLGRGQKVTIVGSGEGVYKCLLEVEGQTDTVYLNYSDVHKIAGELWYKVRLNDGREGWIYGDYVRVGM